jgi:hypothetical protein
VEEQAHTTQDDEPTLMFAYGAMGKGASSTRSCSPNPHPPLPNTDTATSDVATNTATATDAALDQIEQLEANPPFIQAS